MSERRFQGKRVVVSGGATGVGAAAVRMFASEGAELAIIDLNQEGGAALAAEIQAGGTTAHFIYADLGRPAEVEQAAARVADLWDGADVLFNHAGTVLVKPFLQTTADDWSALLGTNVVSMALMSRGVIPLMLNRGGGSIVITSSISGLTASPLESAYCVTKAACLQLARAIAVEFRGRGIRANAVCPGFIRTPHGLREMAQLADAGEALTDQSLKALQGRICEPEEVAQVVLYLASEQASFVNGAAVAVDNAAMAAT